MSKRFSVAGYEVAQNSKAEIWLKVLELNDTTDVRIPVAVINGAEEGPTVFIGAGAHGTEYTSILAAVDVIAKLEPVDVCGRVICAPIQSIPAFRDRQRNVTLNDEEGYNLHRDFPGDEHGGPPFRIAHFLFQRLVLDTDAAFAFDLHTCSHTHVGPAHAFVAPESFGEVAQKALEAAAVFGTHIVIREKTEWDPMTQRGVYAQVDMPHMLGAVHGVPTLGLELVEEKPVRDEHVRVGSEGVRNVLRHLGVLRGSPPQKNPQIVLEEVVYVRNDRGGLVRQHVVPGDFLHSGDSIVTILTPFGHVAEIVRAPVDGYLMTLIAYGAIHEGEMVARIGVPALGR